MSDFLPKEVREGLEQARKAKLKRRSRLRVRVGDMTYPILRSWETGLVDVYDGSKYLYQALIVAAQEDGQEMSFDFKRATLATDKPPLDYDRADDAPVALLPIFH